MKDEGGVQKRARRTASLAQVMVGECNLSTNPTTGDRSHF